MRKLIVRIILFSSLIFIIDASFGYFFNYLQTHVKGGDTYRNNYICYQTNEDLLIFGSSRAIHHYNSQILEDSLNMSCYNCGQDGNGIILLFGRLKLITQRYYPRVIIYDVYHFDLLVGDDNRKYLGWLRPYYKEACVDSIFWDVDYTEKFKMYSKMYQYNSKILQLLGDNIYPMQTNGLNGFRPLRETMKYEPIIKETKLDAYRYDTQKLFYIHKFIQETKNKTEVIFMASPLYKAKNSNVFNPLKDICIKNGIPFLDYYCDPEISTNKGYFKDEGHLNSDGANAYTKKIIPEIKALLKKKRLTSF